MGRQEHTIKQRQVTEVWSGLAIQTESGIRVRRKEKCDVNCASPIQVKTDFHF